MKKFHIQTLGCKVNQYESDGIGSTLEKKGWEKEIKMNPVMFLLSIPVL